MGAGKEDKVCIQGADPGDDPIGPGADIRKAPTSTRSVVPMNSAVAVLPMLVSVDEP